MKISETDVLIHPGLGGGSPDHWYTGWLRKLPHAKRVEQRDWDAPRLEPWIETLVTAVQDAKRPVLLVAHSLGVLSVVHAAPYLPKDRIAGAYLVCAPDAALFDATLPACLEFAPAPTDPLPFPSQMVASRNDPYCDYGVAEDLAYAWGAPLIDAGQSGHINPDSGHGPWPEGLLRLAPFLKRLG